MGLLLSFLVLTVIVVATSLGPVNTPPDAVLKVLTQGIGLDLGQPTAVQCR